MRNSLDNYIKECKQLAETARALDKYYIGSGFTDLSIGLSIYTSDSYWSVKSKKGGRDVLSVSNGSTVEFIADITAEEIDECTKEVTVAISKLSNNEEYAKKIYAENISIKILELESELERLQNLKK